MLGSISTNRNVLKYLVSRPLIDQLSTQSSYQSFRSKSAASCAVSKRTVTKKKYSELPALSLQAACELATDAVLVSNTSLTLDLPECTPFVTPNVHGRLLTWSWPLPHS